MTPNLRELFTKRPLRYRWEYRKLVLHEWWLRVVLRRPPALAAYECRCIDDVIWNGCPLHEEGVSDDT